MSSLHWFPFYWGKYSNKTMHLSQGQHGAYILFLHWVYTTESPIPHKQRFSIARASLDLERSDASFVLEQFFSKRGQAWHNEVAEQVIAESKEKHEKRAKAGQLGGLKKASNATPTLEHCSTIHTNTHIEEDKRVLITRFVVGKKNGGSNGVTIQDPSERLNRFQKWLAGKIGANGWVIVAAAADPSNPEYLTSLILCQRTAASHGKGWPKQWPA